MNDLDIHPSSSQLLLLNGLTVYHFLFVDCCFKVFIDHIIASRTVFKTLYHLEVNVIACDLENSYIFDNEA